MQVKADDKSEYIGFHCDPDLKRAIERFAKEDDRALSNLMRRIVAEYVLSRQRKRARKPE